MILLVATAVPEPARQCLPSLTGSPGTHVALVFSALPGDWQDMDVCCMTTLLLPCERAGLCQVRGQHGQGPRGNFQNRLGLKNTVFHPCYFLIFV